MAFIQVSVWKWGLRGKTTKVQVTFAIISDMILLLEYNLYYRKRNTIIKFEFS